MTFVTVDKPGRQYSESEESERTLDEKAHRKPIPVNRFRLPGLLD